jgi:phosphatidylglycerol---prolipoprotein diacylglyceryl transferase
MHPKLTTLHFHGGSWPIGSYGVLLVGALGVGAWLAMRRGLRAGLEEGALISSLALALGGGFVGAFALSVGVRFAQLGSLTAALAQPGIVFFGALLGGALALAVAARCFELPVLVTLDVMLPAVPVAHAIGRVGCFFGGCCFGAPSALPWSVIYPSESFARHPWPLYEAALLCVLALIFWRPLQVSTSTEGGLPRMAESRALEGLPSRVVVPGRRAVAYVMCYAALRLLLEPLRGDVVRGVFWSVSTSQLIAASVIVGCAYAFKKLRPATLCSAAGRGSVTKSVTASGG